MLTYIYKTAIKINRIWVQLFRRTKTSFRYVFMPHENGFGLRKVTVNVKLTFHIRLNGSSNASPYKHIQTSRKDNTVLYKRSRMLTLIVKFGNSTVAFDFVCWYIFPPHPIFARGNSCTEYSRCSDCIWQITFLGSSPGGRLFLYQSVYQARSQSHFKGLPDISINTSDSMNGATTSSGSVISWLFCT